MFASFLRESEEELYEQVALKVLRPRMTPHCCEDKFGSKTVACPMGWATCKERDEPGGHIICAPPGSCEPLVKSECPTGIF